MRAQGIPDAAVKTHIALYAVILITTEILSTINELNFIYIFYSWIILSIFLAIGLCSSIFINKCSFRFDFSNFNKNVTTNIILVAIFFLIGATLFTSLAYPPNNWDSMTYRMSRIVNWMSNENVGFYPTSIERQLYQMPLAEYAVLHLQILSGTDIFANCVQWASYIVSIISVGLIAKEFFLSKMDQYISSLAFATIPMAILQASSTQNDLVVTSFVLSFSLFMLRLNANISYSNAMLASLALGLALLTKGTAWIYCMAIGIFLSVPILKNLKFSSLQTIKGFFLLIFIVLFALIVNSGHIIRSYQTYDKPIASGSETYFNENITPKIVGSNLFRNIALHTGTKYESINRKFYLFAEKILGQELNNPYSTWPWTSFSIPYSRHEDTAGNPLHLIVILFTILTGIFWLRHQNIHVHCYFFGILSAVLLYCILLKWQPWASRLHTPLFALFCPIIVFSFNQFSNVISRWIKALLVILMFSYSVQFAINNDSRSLQSLDWTSKTRMELYFVNRPHLFESYKQAMHIVNSSGHQDVGLYIGVDDWEYPFWALRSEGIRFHHFGVNNKTKILKSKSIIPSYIIATKNMNEHILHERYDPVFSDKNLVVLHKNPDFTENDEQILIVDDTDK